MDRLGRSARLQSPAPAASRAETAAYVAGLAGDLSRMSQRHGMPTLAYLLDVARLEAELHTREETLGPVPGADDDASDPGVGLA